MNLMINGLPKVSFKATGSVTQVQNQQSQLAPQIKQDTFEKSNTKSETKVPVLNSSTQTAVPKFSEPKYTQTDIFYINDNHGRIGNMARIYSAKEFYDSISFREIEPTENMGKIVSFDVANQILLAFSSQKIAVCDTSGKILKAFEYQTYGNYYVQWCGDDIQIYFVRGDSLLTVTQDGELASCIAVNPDRATNETSIQKLEHKTTCEISGVTYKIQKGRPILELLSGYKYTQMVKIDNTGRETILYDCTAQYSSETPTIIVLIIMCCLIMFTIVIYWQKNGRKSQ